MAEYAVLVSARAEADLLAARRWLTQPGSGLKARLRMARIGRAVTELQFTPGRWPMGPADGTRQRLVEGYTIVYRIDAHRLEVRIMRVFGPYQDQARI